MEQFNFPFCEEYSHSLEFKTSVVRRSDGSEQRQALWMCPKRTFSLNFEATEAMKTSLEAFFRQQKGDFEQFLWRWDESYFGDNHDYACFLGSSKLSRQILPHAYSKTPLTLIAIDDGNFLRGRYFLDNKFWSFVGNVEISSKKASYQGVSRLFQSGVLTLGRTYRLKVKTQDIQGLPPVLSSQTAILDEIDGSFFEGDKTVEFVAVGADLVFETSANTSGSFCEIALFEVFNSQAVFDFQHNIEHQSELIFSTLTDEVFTFQNSRQNLVETPLRRWVLTFELTPFDAKRFEAFFVSKRGRYKAFTWIYEGEEISVRFDTDKLDQKQYQLGYREVKIPIIEVLQ